MVFINLEEMAEIVAKKRLESVLLVEDMGGSFFFVSYKQEGRYYDLYFKKGVTKEQVIKFLKGEHISFYETKFNG